MTKGSADNEIRDHYGRMKLDDTHVAAILGARELAVSARRWKLLAVSALLCLAGAALVATGLSLHNAASPLDGGVAGTTSRDSGDPRGAMAPPIAGRPSSDSIPEPRLGDPTKLRSTDADETSGFRLVAFRSHTDACPHCRSTGEVYRDLARSLREEPLQFEQFDFSDSSARKSIDRRIQELQLASLIEGRMETAFLALTDADGAVVKEFKPSMGSERIGGQVRQLLARNR